MDWAITESSCDMVEEVSAKTILSPYRKESFWFGTNFNMNLYRGCSHGCIYCDSRSECYHVTEFDRVRIKKDALLILEQELRRSKHTGVVGCGAMSDPYNPLEPTLCLSQGAFALLDRYEYGLALATKSALVTRDIALFQQIQVHSPVLIKVTLTTVHDALAAVLEPNVSRPSERLEALRQLRAAGIPCCVLLMPCLPFIEDDPEDIRILVRRCAEAGVKYIYPGFGVTLRANQRDWFYEKLALWRPELVARYQAQYGNAYECDSPNAARLKAVFREECDRFGLLYRQPDIQRDYRAIYEKRNQQLTFFDGYTE